MDKALETVAGVVAALDIVTNCFGQHKCRNLVIVAKKYGTISNTLLLTVTKSVCRGSMAMILNTTR